MYAVGLLGAGPECPWRRQGGISFTLEGYPSQRQLTPESWGELKLFSDASHCRLPTMTSFRRAAKHNISTHLSFFLPSCFPFVFFLLAFPCVLS